MDSCRCSISYTNFNVQHEPPWYGTVCPVVWEDGGGNPASYPIRKRLMDISFQTLREQRLKYRGYPGRDIGGAYVSDNVRSLCL